MYPSALQAAGSSTSQYRGPSQSLRSINQRETSDPSPNTPQHGKIPRFRPTPVAHGVPPNSLPQPSASPSLAYEETLSALQRVRNFGLFPTVLSLNYLDVSNDECELISQALTEKNFGLTGLTLACNRITSQGLAFLAHALQNTQRLTSLHLQNNLIDDTGMSVLGAALKVNTSLKELWLYDNRVTSKGTLPLVEALAVNRSLIALRLDKNLIDNDGAKVFAQVLKLRNTTLQVLDLRFNDITDEASMTLIQQCLTLNYSRPRILAFLVCSRPRAPQRTSVQTFFKHPLFEKNVLKVILQFAGLKPPTKT